MSIVMCSSCESSIDMDFEPTVSAVLEGVEGIYCTECAWELGILTDGIDVDDIDM